MTEEVKVLLGEAAANFTDAQISLVLKMCVSDVETYCNRDIDRTLELVAVRMAVIRLLRIDSEGLTAASFGGVNESYLDGLPADIKAILNRKRRLKVI